MITYYYYCKRTESYKTIALLNRKNENPCNLAIYNDIIKSMWKLLSLNDKKVLHNRLQVGVWTRVVSLQNQLNSEKIQKQAEFTGNQTSDLHNISRIFLFIQDDAIWVLYVHISVSKKYLYHKWLSMDSIQTNKKKARATHFFFFFSIIAVPFSQWRVTKRHLITLEKQNN